MARKPTGRPNGRPRKPRWIDDYAAIGPLPADPLLAMEFGFKALMVSLQKTMLDPGMNERDRSSAIRQILKTAKDMIPKARLAELERKLDAFEKRQQGGARSQDAAPTVADASTDAGSALGGSYRSVRARRT